MTRSHWMTGAAIAALSLLTVPAAAGADTIGTLFEPPSFAPGNVKAGRMAEDGRLRRRHRRELRVDRGGLRPAEPPHFQRDDEWPFGDQTFSAPLVDGAGEASSNGGQAGGERQPHFDATFQFIRLVTPLRSSRASRSPSAPTRATAVA